VEMKWKANLNGDDEAMKKKLLEKRHCDRKL
jgi:hypothetical protein